MTHIPLSLGVALSGIQPGDCPNEASSILPAMRITLRPMVSVPKFSLIVAADCAAVCSDSAVCSAWRVDMIAGVSVVDSSGVSTAQTGAAISTTVRPLSSVP